MKILIACDMEGITGVVNWEQVTPGHYEYPRFRKLMTADVNAAIRGAFEGGATEVSVADGHWDGTNLLIEELDPRARLNAGTSAPFSMMQGISAETDAVLFVGYHARQGSQNAVLDHTWSRKCVSNLWLNETLVGEYGLNAALAGHFEVPILLITGDQTVCAQARELLGEVMPVVVKQATGRTSAECLAPEVSQKLISDTARRALQNLKRGNAPAPFIIGTPILVTVDFMTSDMADRAMRLPNSLRDENRVSFEAADMVQAYTAFRSLVGLANT